MSHYSYSMSTLDPHSGLLISFFHTIVVFLTQSLLHYCHRDRREVV